MISDVNGWFRQFLNVTLQMKGHKNNNNNKTIFKEEAPVT